MALDVLVRARAVSDAVAELSREVARSVVLVRGSRGSAGSGVIWDRPKLVITNHHVVHAQTAELVIADGRRLLGRVVRREPSLDLAALEVDDELEPRAQIGDSDALRVGDLVLAVGNPMGERNAPSLGIVSGQPDDIVRLSITLRPGNSGGALVNARGEVVGIPHLVAGSGLAMAVSTRTVARFLGGAPLQSQGNLIWI
ncbi:MAG TPA: trypsin-like peptidase domain-containing protein [Chloroflexota bacterium]|jgi:serine protease Do|nr:trypsin-like peptidase domain-containing protein [Chloroflexota bacterium]